MSQRKIQTSTTCVMLYECIIYRLLYRCFLPMFRNLSIASIALCTMDFGSLGDPFLVPQLPPHLAILEK